MKYTLIALVVVVVLGAAYWFASGAGWLEQTGPDNLPTRAERERMEEIEQSSAQIAPDAKAGIQVRPKGSTPPPPPVTPQATSTETSTSTPTSESDA